MESSVFPDFSKRSKTELITIISQLKTCLYVYRKYEGKLLICDIWDKRDWGDLEIERVKKCLKLAKQAYTDLDKEHELNRAERKAKAFEEKLWHIKKISFSTSGCGPEGYGEENFSVFFTGEQAFCEIRIEEGDIKGCEVKRILYNHKLNREEFLYALQELNIGEWYSKIFKSPGFIIDGGSWEMRVKYDDKTKPFIVTGDIHQPYNIKKFLRLLKMKGKKLKESKKNTVNL